MNDQKSKGGDVRPWGWLHAVQRLQWPGKDPYACAVASALVDRANHQMISKIGARGIARQLARADKGGTIRSVSNRLERLRAAGFIEPTGATYGSARRWFRLVMPAVE